MHSDLIKLGVSSCLLGNLVRYDGGHQHNKYITGVLAKYFTFVPVCPEVECGLSVPREAMRLVNDIENPTLITIRSKIDLTEQMLSYCRGKVIELEKSGLCGFIFKKDSPSSGLHRVKVYLSDNNSVRKGRGLFAATFVEHFPLLPVEDEGRLQDEGLRENFLERVFCYSRWKDFLSRRPDYKELIKFHTAHKLQLMAHSPKHYREAGKLVAAGKDISADELLKNYEILLMQALQLKATAKKNVNVLQHIMGYFKKVISSDEKAELLELFESYARETVPLIVPLTLVNHYVRKYDIEYLKGQTYLAPHPSELMLRNHV